MYYNFQELSVALKSNWAILPVTVGVHLVNFVDHSGQFAHLTTVPAQFTISKTWHAASLTPHWRGEGFPRAKRGSEQKLQKECLERGTGLPFCKRMGQTEKHVINGACTGLAYLRTISVDIKPRYILKYAPISLKGHVKQPTGPQISFLDSQAYFNPWFDWKFPVEIL